MATAISPYGPYYTSAIRKTESQRKALTGQGYSPEELAGLSYGELMARYKDTEARQAQQQQYGIQQGYLTLAQEQAKTQSEQFQQELAIQQQGLQLQSQGMGLASQQLGLQKRAASGTEAGQIVSGIATGVNVLDKLGVTGELKKGIQSLFPSTPTGQITGVMSPQDITAAWPEAGAIEAPSGMVGESMFAGFDFTPLDTAFQQVDVVGGMGEGCFITTAAVEHIGLKDAGKELNTLRWFRDNVLSKMPGGKENIEEYYRIAPEIVKMINRQPDPHKVYLKLWNFFIHPAIEAIESHKYIKARSLYEGMVRRLRWQIS